MFVNYPPVFLVFTTTFGLITAEFMSINWNKSVNDGDLHLEREYKYPMFEEVAPVPCDLSDSCDIFCCHDKDCDEYQRGSFLCNDSIRNCGETLSYFDCSCDEVEKPEWFSLLCYVFKNPIYLGKFFTTPKKIEKISTFQNLISKKINGFFNNENHAPVHKSISEYKFGSSIKTYIPTSDSSKFPSVSSLLRKVSLKDSSHACKTSSVKYRVNGVTVCRTKLTAELCESGHALSVLPYLVQDGGSYNYSNTPLVLKNLDFLEGIETEVTIKCLQSKFIIKKLQKQKVYYFQSDGLKQCASSFSSYLTKWNNNTCENVLTHVGYHFVLNGSDIIQLKVQYGLTNLSLPSAYNDDDVIDKYIYFKQIFNVSFFDVMNINSEKQNMSEDDGLYNRGYFVGEELNFGYRSVNSSSTSWERGALRTFKNGRSCEKAAPVTFGFDCFSTCRIRRKFPNCKAVRREMENIFEDLAKGDSLAIYSNLRAPFEDSVPLLKNFVNFTESNSTDCHVPILQHIIIQYATIFTEYGEPIHRIIGARMDRAFQNISTDVDVTLTAQVSFYRVVSKEKSLSRFWMKMLSPELSENAWLNIFRVVEDVSPAEKEEITFWCTLLVFATSGVLAYTKLDFNFGKFLLYFYITGVVNATLVTLPFVTD